jgi:hypothetical protein
MKQRRAPRMPRTQSTTHLYQLRQKHGDRYQSKKSLQAVSSLGPSTSKGKGKKKPSLKKFSTTFDTLTPAGHRQVFGQLYSFFFFMMTLFFIWMGYRMFFQGLPVWFDEGVAKALIFGVPVVWFASQSRFIANELGLNQEQLFPGLFLGIAVGGLYGFAALLIQVAAGQEVVQGSLFATSGFWWMAFLALLTAWWESLFFFGLPIQYVRSVAPWFSESLLAIFVVVLFLLFHAPLRFVVTGVTPQFIIQMGLLTLFVVGQFIFYLRTKNMYALVLSHLLWGLVIELYAV